MKSKFVKEAIILFDYIKRTRLRDCKEECLILLEKYILPRKDILEESSGKEIDFCQAAITILKEICNLQFEFNKEHLETIKYFMNISEDKYPNVDERKMMSYIRVIWYIGYLEKYSFEPKYLMEDSRRNANKIDI